MSRDDKMEFVQNRINKIIESYGDKKPTVEYSFSGSEIEIWAKGGNWQAHKDIENHIYNSGKYNCIGMQNYPDGKHFSFSVK